MCFQFKTDNSDQNLQQVALMYKLVNRVASALLMSACIPTEPDYCARIGY